MNASSCFARVRTALLFPILLVAVLPTSPIAHAQKGKKPAGGDAAPPAAITDLNAGTIIDNSIPIAWTATGDDGTVGTASGYQIRYLDLTQAGLTVPSESDPDAFCTSVMESQWSVAKQDVLDVPSPQPAGSSETYRIKLLAENTPYCVALKVFDDVSKLSDLSNGIYAVTETPLPATWTSELVDPGPSVWLPSLAFDVEGSASVAYLESAGDEIRLATRGDAGWSRETVDTGNAGDGSPSAVFTPSGGMAIALIHTARGGAGDLVLLERSDAAGMWQRQSIDGRKARNPSLVYSDAGPAVCYFMHNEGIKYARRNASGWSVELVDPAGNGVCNLALDSTGEPIMTYRREWDGDGIPDVAFARRSDGGDWSTSLVAPGADLSRQGFVFDGTHGLVVFNVRSTVYSERYIRLAHVEPSTGFVVSVDDVADTGYNATLTIVQGEPVVVYEDIAYLYAAHRTGTSWESEVVAYTPRGDGGSIRTDPVTGQAAIAYHHRTLAGNYELYFARPAAANTSDAALAGAARVAPEAESRPGAITLSVAYPNPFNPTTTFSITLPDEQHVLVEAFDVVGRRVATLHQGVLTAGTHTLRFEASALPAGTYMIRASGNHGFSVRKVLLMK